MQTMPDIITNEPVAYVFDDLVITNDDKLGVTTTTTTNGNNNEY